MDFSMFFTILLRVRIWLRGAVPSCPVSSGFLQGGVCLLLRATG